MDFSRTNSFYNLYIKRILGFILALFLFCIGFWLYIIIAIFIVCETGFPVFYRADRGGYKGKPFKIFKFRSMVKNADKIGGGTTALNDSRITKVGNFLRKTKLDEFPQLFNIMQGTMSFIGPRPELLQYTDKYEGDEKHILDVRPGITDYSSIEFISLDEIVGGDNADEVYEEKVLKKKNQLRMKYAQEVSFATDVKLFFLTIFKTFSKAQKVVTNGNNKA